MIRKTGHFPFGRSFSFKSIKVLGSMFVWCRFHLRLKCNVGRYSISRLFQNWLDIATNCFHLLRLDMSPSFSSIFALLFYLPNKRWFGVSGSRSLGLSLTQVRGRLLTIAWISVNIVINWNSVRTVFLIMLNMTFLTVLIILSHISLICGAAGGLKCHVICSLDEYSLIGCYLMFNSLVVPFRLVPQSLYTSLGYPLLLTNLWKLPMKLSES